jgi:hypothetical protein
METRPAAWQELPAMVCLALLEARPTAWVVVPAEQALFDACANTHNREEAICQRLRTAGWTVHRWTALGLAPTSGRSPRSPVTPEGVLSTEPRHGRSGRADSQKTASGVEFTLLEQTKVEPDLRDASSPSDTRGRDTGWWWRVEHDLRPNKLVKTIVVQYDGVTVQDSRDILGGCF